MNRDRETQRTLEVNDAPGTASLVDQLDRVVLLVLFDGRTIVGILRSYDQYGSVFLDQCVERKTHNTFYCDVAVGFLMVRAENIVLIGELKEPTPSNMARIGLGALKEMQAAEQVTTTRATEFDSGFWD
ncbi:LSM domain [Carpediemonas membranifera]|uniref:U6 snRNA-associated Sm-like protein LSm1 n=1 Tax=Carpediemonas membranifera TaxID=201153 RepID=A0A8J6E051_9EUKA|nr:LSM domain [Carpediemonas membranifera]|eukprot:KAG9391316.1 LSM domain [Carpediemonas membranifera]